MRTVTLVGCLFTLVLTFLPSPSNAQTSGGSADDRKELLGYSLTLPKANELIAAMTDMTKYMMSRPDVAQVMARSMKMTNAERIAQMESDPKAMAIAKQHGLTAREYIYGVPALRMAVLSAEGQSAPNIIASPANVAFAKANLAQLKPKLDAADSAGRR